MKKGQPIVELDEAVAQADLAEKTATRDGLVASLALLKSIPRPEERRANELAVEQAKVALEQATVAADRLRPLASRHEVPEQQVQDAERAVRQAAIQLQTAEATLHVMMIGPRPEAIAEAEGKIKTADALVGLLAGPPRIPHHPLADRRRARQPDLPPRPDDRHRQPDRRGGRYAAGLRLDLARARRRRRRCASASSLASGPRTLSPRSSGPDEGEMAGKVAFVGRVADPQTGNLPIRVLVDNPQGRLTIGQSIQVSVVVEEHKAVLQVPTAAILDLGEGPVLSVVRDGKSVVLHPEVGTAQGGWTEVAGTDLKPGEPVIVEGGYNLPENTAVKLSDAEGGAKPPDEAEAKGHAESEAEGTAPRADRQEGAKS